MTAAERYRAILHSNHFMKASGALPPLRSS